MIERERAIPYVGYHVDNAQSTDVKSITDQTRLVGWQCGFEPMFVAVHNYLPECKCDDEEAEELATDLLTEIGWFGLDEQPREPDYIL